MRMTFVQGLGTVALFLLMGCGRSDQRATSDRAGNTARTSGPGGSGGTVGTVSSGGKSANGGASGGSSGGASGSRTTDTRAGSCTYTCYVDFPCHYQALDEPKCEPGNNKVLAYGEDVSCEETCGTRCCSGGTCRTHTKPCAAGTVCVYPIGSMKAECVDASKTCGGASGKTCAADEYCEFFGGQCDERPGSVHVSCDASRYRDLCDYANGEASGLCSKIPSESECTRAGFTRPVCGCDGVTYPNDCARMAAGVAIDYPGECRAKPDAAMPSDYRDGGVSGACSEVPCLAALFLPCQPVGACTLAINRTPEDKPYNTFCYPNGVKIEAIAYDDPSPTVLFTGVTTAKRDSTECYAIESKTMAETDMVSYIYRDGNGRQVATGTSSAGPRELNIVTVTCDGEEPVQVGQSCWDIVDPSKECPSGKCTY